MLGELARTAIVCDCDGTLAAGNLQECSLIPKMNMIRDGRAVHDAATQQLRKKIGQITKSGNTALIVLLLLSYGGTGGTLFANASGCNDQRTEDPGRCIPSV